MSTQDTNTVNLLAREFSLDASQYDSLKLSHAKEVRGLKLFRPSLSQDASSLLGLRLLAQAARGRRDSLSGFPFWERATVTVRVEPNIRRSSSRAPTRWQARQPGFDGGLVSIAASFVSALRRYPRHQHQL
ncbi:hypothetical protein HPB50_022413 [Hyalomma asiaticum]|uniref:Uncharacterized protein n=1 Tax=Hyalomma asiaticum TaxID=266040 RepID=A0ACB7SS77_HYAAI|nr:hypothetical protein HPB50_022413 [Hyalomma asiaticum]